jgi:hypothetical protein
MRYKMKKVKSSVRFHFFHLLEASYVPASFLFFNEQKMSMNEVNMSSFCSSRKIKNSLNFIYKVLIVTT